MISPVTHEQAGFQLSRTLTALVSDILEDQDDPALAWQALTRGPQYWLARLQQLSFCVTDCHRASCQLILVINDTVINQFCSSIVETCGAERYLNSLWCEAP